MEKSCSFKPGDRLVCKSVSDSNKRSFAGVKCPLELRKIYTCRSIGINRGGKVCLTLEEIPVIKNAFGQMVNFPTFGPSRFEKLVDLGWTQDLSVVVNEPDAGMVLPAKVRIKT